MMSKGRFTFYISAFVLVGVVLGVCGSALYYISRTDNMLREMEKIITAIMTEKNKTIDRIGRFLHEQEQEQQQ